MPPSPSRADMIRDIRAAAALLRVVHHIPGRVRLKLDGDVAGLGRGVEDAGRVARAAAETAGIRAVNLNPLARSCVVEYDPRIISPAAWPDLVGGVRSDAAEALLAALAEAGGG